MASLRTKTLSLLRSSLHLSQDLESDEGNTEKYPGRALSSNTEPLMSEKLPHDENTSLPDKPLSLSSAEKTVNFPGDSVFIENLKSQRLVRTLPTWAYSLDEDGEQPKPSPRSLPFIPPAAQVATHNNGPSTKPKHKVDLPRGKVFDAQRESVPPLPHGPFSEDAPKWREFARSSIYAPAFEEHGEIVTEAWLIQNGGDYSRPWLATSENEDAHSEAAHFFQFRTQRKVWWRRLQRIVLRSPVIPLVIRTVVWIFSLVALALGSTIHKIADDAKLWDQVNSPSPNMAIIVDAIALMYIFYITYDEYSGKPLGLRSATAKMRLIFLDLFFIVFDSANLSLAFAAISDSDEICNKGALQRGICHRQKALASVLLIALIAWLMTFSISVLRLVERVTGQ